MRGPDRHRLGLSLLLLVAVLAGPPRVGAQPGRPAVAPYRIDLARSQLTFKATSRLQNADGVFHRFEGEVNVDPANLATARLSLTVDATSIDTKNRKRDDHLRSADFFDVARHPVVTFQSDRVTPGGGLVTVHGRLTMRGVSREIDVLVQVEFVGDEALVARGEFVLDRRDYGIDYSSVLNPVHDAVRVAFTFHARRKA
jgi:polyisoprenoid-binding protein YceI